MLDAKFCSSIDAVLAKLKTKMCKYCSLKWSVGFLIEAKP